MIGAFYTTKKEYLPRVALRGGAFTAVLLAPLLTHAGTFVPISGPNDIPSALWNALSAGDFASMVNALFVLSIGIAALLAVVMIIIAGLQYMGSDSFSSKGAAKARLGGVVIGLLIILGAYLILSTISGTLVSGPYP